MLVGSLAEVQSFLYTHLKYGRIMLYPLASACLFPDNFSYSLHPVELNLGVYSKTMRSAYYLEVMLQRFLEESQPFT